MQNKNNSEFNDLANIDGHFYLRNHDKDLNTVK